MADTQHGRGPQTKTSDAQMSRTISYPGAGMPPGERSSAPGRSFHADWTKQPVIQRRIEGHIWPSRKEDLEMALAGADRYSDSGGKGQLSLCGRICIS